MSLFSDLAYRYAPALSAHHALRRTRALALNRFRDGQIAKVVGEVSAVVAPLQAPLSGRECVFFRVEIQVQDPQSTGWIPLFEHLGGYVFAIADGTDSAIVEMPRARTSLMTDVDTLARPRLAKQAVVAHILQTHGYPFFGWMPDEQLTYHDGFASRRLRCIEGTITPGEQLAVCGYGLREVGRDPDKVDNYRQMPTRLVFRAQRRCPLLVSDRPQTMR